MSISPIMVSMTDRELMEWDQAGFIPGPGETEAAFKARVLLAKEKFEKGNWIPPAHWDWARESLCQLFNVKPLYICAFYSNRSLTPWQGAACWLEGKKVNSIQLRKALKKGTFLGLYRREEILAHEAVHAARSAFEEEQCEEFFAYMTSEKKWRRVLGPIVQRPWEVWPLLVCLAGGVIWPLCYWGATFWMTAGFIRLIRQHYRLRRAAQQISRQVSDPRLIRAILFRLTDAEIEKFSRGEKIEEYAKTQTCLRWKVVKNYMKETYDAENRCGK